MLKISDSVHTLKLRCNLYTMKLIFEANSSVSISIFTRLCNCHYFLILEHFHHSLINPIPTKSPPFFLLPAALQFSCSVVSDSVTPWIAAHQASLSITNSWSLLKPMSIESVMPSSHLILCHPLLLLPPIPPSIRVFSNESTLRLRWPKYWSFSF